MKKNILCLQLILIASLLFANTTDLFIPSDYALEASKLGESMSDKEFMHFAFVFSEIQESKIPAYMQKYNMLASKLKTELDGRRLSDFDKGEYILSFLHKNLFKTYREPITNLNNLFDSGVYNCVSSSIVYYALADRFNLAVTGVKTFDHAFCSVVVNGEIIDVETTSQYGFNPGEKKEFENSFGQTGFVYTPPSNYRDRTSIGKTSLLSLILQNRIVELYKTQRFDTITHIAVNINALLQTEGSKEAMIREFGNYAAYLSKRNQFGQGITFFSEAENYFGQHEQFNELAGSLFNNGIATYLSYRTIHQLRQNISNAQKFFNTYKDEKVISRHIVQSSQQILDEATIRIFVEDNSFDNSILELKQYSSLQKINQDTFTDLALYVYSKKISDLMNTQSWEEALSVAQNCITDTKQDRRSLTQLQQVEYNIGAYYHNRFATLYNRQEFTEAMKVLQEGLRMVPNHKTLLSDKKLLHDTV